MFDNKWQKKEMPLVSLIGMGGGIASPAFLASIVLNILKPTVFSPVDDTGVPDFDYTAESSAITDISTVDTLGDAPAFNTTIWTGNSSTRIIDSGIDNTAESLVWIKNRDGADNHRLFDTIRGPEEILSTNGGWYSHTGTSSELSEFTSTGFDLGPSSGVNYNTHKYVSWNFRSEPGFFDAVTWTGDGSGTRDINHSLGSAPAIMIWKKANATSDWSVYHKDVGTGYGLYLNTTDSKLDTSLWGTGPTTTNFPAHAAFNLVGEEYVAYLFADNPSNQIKCGSYTGNGTSGASSNATHLDFDPEWLLVKNIDSSGSDWCIVDTTRGQLNQLTANNAETESNTGSNGLALFDGHFQAYGSSVDHNQSGDTYIYVAIGSPKVTVSNTQLTLTDTTVSRVSDGSLVGGSTIDQVLTVGETVQADTAISSTVTAPVFSTTLYNGNGQSKDLDTGIDNTDKSLIWFKNRDLDYPHILIDTVRGFSRLSSNNAQPGYSSGIDVTSFNDSGVSLTNGTGWVNHPSGHNMVAWNFRAAPGFFDVVSWSGNSVNGRQISHDLGSAPGAIIIKNYSNTANWEFWHNSFDADDYMGFNATNPKYDTSGPWNNTLPTSEHFTVSSDMDVNRTGDNYVAYLFADTPGLIKCGSYTGNGQSVSNTTEINCGFRPQWLMVKSTNISEGDNASWCIFDNQRGYNIGGTFYSNQVLHPNSEQDESFKSGNSTGYSQGIGHGIQFTDNGFICKDNAYLFNDGAYPTNYIFVAIAENSDADITSDIYATGTVSASSGNTITLSNTTGTWSTGMKVQGVTTDTKDNPDPIKAENVSLTSSAPTAERNVSTWGDAVWEIATDENFTQNVQTANTALSATGTQAGPSFTFEPETGYYARTKYTALGQESEWSDVTYFLTEGLPVHWITTISDPNGDNLGQQSSLVTDSQNNVLVSTYNSQNRHNLVKFDPQGNISWQRKYSKSGANFYYQFGQNCIDVDNNDDIFIGVMSDAPGGTDMITAKYSNSGTLEWQRKINFSNDRTEAVATDSSGSVFNVGYTESHQQMGNGSGYTINVTKHDSSGNHLFTRAYGDSDDRGYYGKDAHVDSSGDLLVIGFFTHSSGTTYPYLQKVNGTDGSIIFGKTLGSGNHAGGAAAVTTDSSGNIYAAWRARDTNNVYGILFAKYNSSGTLQWKKEIYDGNNAKYVSAIDVDSSDNIYIWGSTDEPNATQGAAGLLIKMDSSGSMVWQRIISGPNTINHGGMSVDTADNIAICGQVYPGGGGNASIFVGKVPSDGSLMGTYNTPFGTYVYAEASNSVRDATSRTSADYTFPRSPLQTGGFTNNENHDSDVYNLTSSPTVLE